MIEDIPRTLSKAFMSEVALNVLCQSGVQIAALPRWRQPKKQNTGRHLREPLERYIQSQLVQLFGKTATWASALRCIVVEGVKYECAGGKSVGNSFIGYLTSSKPEEYVVGRIKKILQVKVEGVSEYTIFVVDRYKPTPRGFNAYLWNRVLAHRALGMLTVGAEVEPIADVVPMERLIGHVAVNRIKGVFGKVLQTMQLSKVNELFLEPISSNPTKRISKLADEYHYRLVENF
jgi:hypothetical protein